MTPVWPHARGITRRALAVLLAALLGGCAVVGPDYEPPAFPMPAKWSLGKKPAAHDVKVPELSRWWTRMNDPILNALVEEAIANNLDVAIAKAQIREARATYRQAVGTLLPTLTNSDSMTRARTGATSTSSSGSGNSTYSTYQAGFDASWELDLFGENRRSVEAASYAVDASEENLRAVILTAIGDIATYYAQARGYQARIALARNTANSQDETARLTRNKQEAGSASAVDAANAAGQAASTRANIPSLEQSYAELVHSMSILTGRPPAALTERLARARPIPAPRLPIPTGIPADILVTRPDVRKAERQYAQYTAKIGQAEAARYPSVSLTGSIDTSGSKTGDLGKNSSISWSFGPSVSIPIFNGGQLAEQVRYAEAQRDEYFIAYRSAVLTALKDVEDALVALSKERQRVRFLNESVAQYRQSASLSRSLYQNGSSSFLDVLTAERSLYSAEDSAIQSRVLITTDYIALNKALGGGWDGVVVASKPEIIDRNTGPHFISFDEQLRRLGAR